MQLCAGRLALYSVCRQLIIRAGGLLFRLPAGRMEKILRPVNKINTLPGADGTGIAGNRSGGYR